MGVSEPTVTDSALPPPRLGVDGGSTGALRRLTRTVLTRLALGAPTRVFVLEGVDAPGALDMLRLRHDVTIVDTPRSAFLLLVAGRLPEAMFEPARRTHDAMAEPRATIWWVVQPAEATVQILPQALVVAAEPHGSPADAVATLAAVLTRTQAELLRGVRPSEPALLLDHDPAPWRSVGPYGQGGVGMTGGVPYGRPMAERAPDRDGLELDQLPVRIGPFFPPFPPGLVLDVTLQGDVVQEAIVPGNAFAASGAHGLAARAGDDPFNAALSRPVRIADLERARARHHLSWLARMLRVHGLEALALRALTLATTLVDTVPNAASTDIVALRRLLERTRGLGWATSGVGIVEASLIRGRRLGPVARAAGIGEDARVEDPVYQELGFTSVVQTTEADREHDGRGDARARWRQRLGEALQSVELAARASDRRTGGEGRPIEGLRGRLSPNAMHDTPSSGLLALLPDLLRGQEWGDAVTTIVSLDIDVREAALARDAAPLKPPPAPRSSGGMGGRAGMGDSADHDHAAGGM